MGLSNETPFPLSSHHEKLQNKNSIWEKHFMHIQVSSFFWISKSTWDICFHSLTLLLAYSRTYYLVLTNDVRTSICFYISSCLYAYTPGVMHIPSHFQLVGQLAGWFSVSKAFDQSAFAVATEMGVDFMEIAMGGAVPVTCWFWACLRYFFAGGWQYCPYTVVYIYIGIIS